MDDRLVSDCIQILSTMWEEETHVNSLIKKTGLYKSRVFKALESLEKANLVEEAKSLTHKQMRIKRLTMLAREIMKFKNDVNRFDQSYFLLLDLVMESFSLSEDIPKDILNRKLRTRGWTIEKINSYPELSERARSFGIPFFLFTLNAVLVRYSTILTSFKVNKTATTILTRMLIDEVTLRIESIPRILQGIGYSGSDPTEFTQRIVDSFFKTNAMIFLEFVRQIIPQGKFLMTDLFEFNALGEYIRSLNTLYNPSGESIDDLISQMRDMAKKDEKLRGSIPIFEKLLRST
jgi:DNA-binding MarR family transcriptional regulator